ncbi:hypothetical protein C2S51_031706 [Perilla frutescens var. frutescens]|nr:hypothetical protein C2S51_031706 [Perilla frutescens var. frutescens]
MGNWNRRFMPRKKHRHYDYEDPPPSPPRSYNYESNSSGLAGNRVPSWEINYCHSVNVPWKKVFASKTYIYNYPSVLNWDGSAGKEALENAKQRFWAMINGLPCDNPLPDPNMYIDEIDWNPYLDPEVMADLDLQVFNPDEAQKVEQLETINEEVEYAQIQQNKNQHTGDNPWERDHVLGTGSSKDVPSWGRWGDAVNLRNDDPWEQSCQKLVDSSKDSAWRSGDKGPGWYQGIDNTRSGKSWNCNEKTVAVRQDGWGQVQGQRENNFIGSKERGWRDNRNVSWGVWDAEYQGNEAKHWDPNFRRGGRSSRGGGRKRESSVQHVSKYKSSRYLGSTNSITICKRIDLLLRSSPAEKGLAQGISCRIPQTKLVFRGL